MIVTSIVGVVAVSVVTLLAIPHWTGIFFIAPLVMILYVDLLGVIQFSGLNVNSVTYIGLVLSIGLIVDYCMHFLLRYIESKGLDREKRVQESLKTIGASVMLGGLSTFLGVVPLGFASSQIIRTVFVIFIALVALGLSKFLVVCLSAGSDYMKSNTNNRVCHSPSCTGHGLILLPVVLSLIGPLNYLEELHGERDGESDEGKSTPKASSNSDVEQAIDARPEQAPDVTAVDDEGMDEVPLGRAPSFDA
jgi:Niemann-Pick C1 protein